MDLAEGHVAALQYMENGSSSGQSSDRVSAGYGEYSVFNLGTGIGYSVVDMIGECM